jgi:hypothetical protein
MAYGFQTAHIMIVEQLLYLWFLIAKRTGWIFSDRKCHEFRVQRTVNQELTDQRLPFFQNELNGLCCLNQSNLPGYNSQDTCLVSTGNQTWRRRLGKETTQTGTSIFWKKNAGLPFNLEDSSINIGFPCKESGIIDEIFRRKIVRSVNDEIVLLENLDRILWSQTFLIGHNLHIRIDSMNRLFG